MAQRLGKRERSHTRVGIDAPVAPPLEYIHGKESPWLNSLMV